MIRIRTTVRVVLILLYALEAAVLAPLHILEEGASHAPVAGFGISAGCDPYLPCQDPDHHHHPEVPSHQPGHCPACSLLGRPAVTASVPGVVGAPGSIGQVLPSPESSFAVHIATDHAPRGPPALPSA